MYLLFGIVRHYKIGKALAGIYGRNEYFELTYNGDEKELYLDVYKKSENIYLKG